MVEPNLRDYQSLSLLIQIPKCMQGTYIYYIIYKYHWFHMYILYVYNIYIYLYLELRLFGISYIYMHVFICMYVCIYTYMYVCVFISGMCLACFKCDSHTVIPSCAISCYNNMLRVKYLKIMVFGTLAPRSSILLREAAFFDESSCVSDVDEQCVSIYLVLS